MFSANGFRSPQNNNEGSYSTIDKLLPYQSETDHLEIRNTYNSSVDPLSLLKLLLEFIFTDQIIKISNTKMKVHFQYTNESGHLEIEAKVFKILNEKDSHSSITFKRKTVNFILF